MSEPKLNDAPIEGFAQCHAGILARLDEFSGLPALLEPAARARRIAGSMLAFFKDAVVQHHREEEAELFPAVLASAAPGEELTGVQALVDRLQSEHRSIEADWAALAPQLAAVAKGRDAPVDPAAVQALVAAYQAHARFEEQQFLPLARRILQRNGDHMAALGLRLHIRSTLPDITANVGFHV